MAQENIFTPANYIAMLAASGVLGGAFATWARMLFDRWIASGNAKVQINIAARNSRASVVSANRQRWIDAIRDDVAHFIAERERGKYLEMYDLNKRQWYIEAYRLNADEHLLKQNAQERILERASLYEKRSQHEQAMNMLQSRIEMRLNLVGDDAEHDHEQLAQSLRQFRVGRCDETKLQAVAWKIFKDEWERLKKEAAGIDPFVKEADPRNVA